MKTTRYDDREITELLLRRGVPTLAWGLVIAFFAFSGLVSLDEPRQKAGMAPVSQLLASESDGAPARVLEASSARGAALRDAAVAEHEALDPGRRGRAHGAFRSRGGSRPPFSGLASLGRR